MTTPNLAIRLRSFKLPSSDIEILRSAKPITSSAKYRSLVSQIEKLSRISWDVFKKTDYWAKYDPISIWKVKQSNLPFLAFSDRSLLIQGTGAFLNESASPYPYRFPSPKEETEIAVAIEACRWLRVLECSPAQKPEEHYRNLDWLANFCSHLNLERDRQIVKTKTAQLTATLTYGNNIKRTETNPNFIKHSLARELSPRCGYQAIS